MIWVVQANSNVCRIYEYDKKTKELIFIKDLSHPESRLKNSELVSDAPGHYKTNGDAHGAYSPREEPKQIEVENFAHEIANELDAARKQNSYDGLILVAPPHMNGLIKQKLNPHVKDMVSRDINKDYGKLTENQRVIALQQDLQSI